jgi:hypothetical protein
MLKDFIMNLNDKVNMNLRKKWLVMIHGEKDNILEPKSQVWDPIVLQLFWLRLERELVSHTLIFTKLLMKLCPIFLDQIN